MQLKLSRMRSFSLASLSLIVALAPIACGSDDDDDSNNTGGTSSAGNGGKTSAGGKTGTGGKTGSGGSSSQGGDPSSDGGDDAVGGAGGAPAAKARVRVIHASPNAPSVDIYAEGASTPAASDVAYGDATPYIELDAGPVAFDLRAAGAEADDEPAFTTEPVELAAGADYSFVAAGDFANAADADVGFRVLSLEHDFEAASAGHAVSRIVHATSAWGEVDVDLAATVDVDLPALAPFASESNVELPADAALEVSFANADGTLSKLTVPELTEGDELTVIATGNPGFPFRPPANGFALLVVDQDGNTSWVREQPWLHLLHASDISTVDVYDSAQTAAAAKLIDDLAAETLGAFQLPASNAGFTLKAVADDAVSGTATGLASGDTSTLEAGEHYLSYIAGDTIETIHEQFDLEQPTESILRGVHASVSILETVDFGAAVSSSLTSALIAGVEPAESSAEAGVAINPGNVILGATATNTLTPLLAEKALSAADAPVAGERSFVLLVGAGELWLVNTAVAGWSLR